MSSATNAINTTHLSETRTVLASQRTFLAYVHASMLVVGIALVSKRRWLLPVAGILVVIGLVQDRVVCDLTYRAKRVPPRVAQSFSYVLGILCVTAVVVQMLA